jgi:two-component system, OmpR family, response regulator
MRLLIAEDDKDLNRQLLQALMQQGYVVDCAFEGEEAAFLGETEPYDAIILDVGLPLLDGITVLKNWRAKDILTPVLILTARDRWSDKVQGFDAGADDYLTKPFHMEELLARVRALLRRSSGQAQDEIVCGAVRVNVRSGGVFVRKGDEISIKLTSHEYRLLVYMMRHMGQILTRSTLIEHIYDQDFDRDSNTIEVFIGRIRRKLGVDLIQTVRGLGYKIEKP